jgi:hypothetical protein
MYIRCLIQTYFYTNSSFLHLEFPEIKTANYDICNPSSSVAHHFFSITTVQRGCMVC